MLSSFPLLFLLLSVAMLIGGGLGYALNGAAAQWRRRFEQERYYYAQYRAETDAHNRGALNRIATLEASLQAGSDDAPPPGDPAADTMMPVDAEPTPDAVIATDEPTGVDLSAIDSAVSQALGRRKPDTSISTLLESVDQGAQAVKLRRTKRPEPAMAVPPETPPPAIDNDAATAPVDEPAEDGAATALAPPGDDLTRIRGIDAELNEDLRALGVVEFADIESMSAIDELALEQRLRLPAGYITAEQWRLQAALLAADGTRGTGTRVRPR